MKTLQEEMSPVIEPGQEDDGPAWLVLKFGGTSVSSSTRWATIRDLIGERLEAGLRPVVVHSALAGVSNGLVEILDQAQNGGYEDSLAEIRRVHLDLAKNLGIDGDALLADDFRELNRILAGVNLVREVSPRLHVRVLSLGELMATKLGAAYLQSQGLGVSWIDARELLCSLDDPAKSEKARYLMADCDYEPDAEMQRRLALEESVILTQGFIARNREGEGVLLGRGGSDTSATYLAAKLGAVGVEIWTDVPGIFSTDPRILGGARLLKRLGYEEAQEIASTGGSVLHPRSIRPVRSFGIPLRVRSTNRPELPGTLISKDSVGDASRVKAISGRSGVTLVSMETVGMWRQVGFLANAFQCFSQAGLSVDLVSTSESNVTVTLDKGTAPIDSHALFELRRRLEKLCRVQILEHVEIVSLVGQKIRGMLHEIGPALEVFDEYRIHLVSQAASDLNLSFVVEEGRAQRLIQELHSILVKPSLDDDLFGETWEQLHQDQLLDRLPYEPWWVAKREQLLQIASSSSPAYVYDMETVLAAIGNMKSLKNVDQVYYAIKANSHEEVLKAVEREGLNFECVSPGEVRRVLDLFEDIDRERILFTPNFAPQLEYAYALKEGIWLTLDNLYPLRSWGEVLAGSKVFLRLDTGQGKGHHKHVRTAGLYSKFGIPLAELPEAKKLAEESGVSVVGLHAHIGSGILRSDCWQEIARVLLSAAAEFPDVRYLDLGGGMGVPEKPGQRPLDVELLDEGLAGIRSSWPDYEIWLEPGRYLVAEAGVLVTRVTQTKGKGAVRYIGVDTGMNSLIRPALYGAYHEIANLSRWGDPGSEVVNVVGPICETGDRLGNDRLLPECAEGDVLLVANAGAYGRVMSSTYNLREPAAEVAI